MTRVSPNADATPMAMPMATSVMPCRITMFRTREPPAPSARRTPISWVRCWTEYAIRPYTPMAASTSAEHSEDGQQQHVEVGPRGGLRDDFIHRSQPRHRQSAARSRSCSWMAAARL